MTKTVNINLSSRVFQIDEDAYRLLENYLEDLKYHFRKEKGSEEIIQDFENRLAELFDEKVRLGYSVVTIEMAEQAIERIGRPEELRDEEENEEEGKERRQQSNLKEELIKKRLYRNPDNKIIGGVASGIAVYFDCDPVWIRLLFVAFSLFYGSLIPVYILLWIIIPNAKTATQKLEMRGKRITVENIGKTVTGNFDRVAGDLHNSGTKEYGFRSFLNGAMRVIGTLLKIVLIFLAIVLFVPFCILSIGLVLSFFIIYFGRYFFVNGSMAEACKMHFPYNLFFSDYYSQYHSFIQNSPILAIFALLALSVSIILPLGAIIRSVIGAFRPLKPISKSLKWTLLALWFVALAFATYSLDHYANIYLLIR